MDKITTIIYIISALALFVINGLEKKDLKNIKKSLFSLDNGGCKHCPCYDAWTIKDTEETSVKIEKKGGENL